MKVVISLGGSIISPDEPDYIKNVASLIKKASENLAIYVVVGGGKLARRYINAGRKLGASEEYLDAIGISATRMNAMLLNIFFNKTIPSSIEEACKISPPVIMGGTVPGHSTDAVGAMLAREIRADRFIIATDVDGIYDKDPKLHKDAKKFDKISIKELRRMAGDEWKQAGKSAVVDAIACRIIEESKIKTCVVNGKNLGELENAIYGKKFNGTLVEIE